LKKYLIVKIMNINKTELQAKIHKSSAYALDFTTALGIAETVKVQSGVTDRAQASALPVT